MWAQSRLVLIPSTMTRNIMWDGHEYFRALWGENVTLAQAQLIPLNRLQWTLLTLKSLGKLHKKSPNKKPPIHVVLEATRASLQEFVYCGVLPVRNMWYFYFKNFSRQYTVCTTCRVSLHLNRLNEQVYMLRPWVAFNVVYYIRWTSTLIM
jgi:hypothetical protein